MRVLYCVFSNNVLDCGDSFLCSKTSVAVVAGLSEFLGVKFLSLFVVIVFLVDFGSLVLGAEDWGGCRWWWLIYCIFSFYFCCFKIFF